MSSRNLSRRSRGGWFSGTFSIAIWCCHTLIKEVCWLKPVPRWNQTEMQLFRMCCNTKNQSHIVHSWMGLWHDICLGKCCRRTSESPRNILCEAFFHLLLIAVPLINWALYNQIPWNPWYASCPVYVLKSKWHEPRVSLPKQIGTHICAFHISTFVCLSWPKPSSSTASRPVQHGKAEVRRCVEIEGRGKTMCYFRNWGPQLLDAPLYASLSCQRLGNSSWLDSRVWDLEQVIKIL